MSQITRVLMSIALYPVVAIALFGSARLIAMLFRRVMPDCWLKRKLLTDTDTGLLAYRPRKRAKFAFNRGLPSLPEKRKDGL